MKKIISTLILMLTVGVVSAQVDSIPMEQDTILRNQLKKGNYLTFEVGGGLHTMAYKMDEQGDDRNSRPGMSFEFGYQHFFSEHWGIGSGANLRTFTTNASFDYESKFSETDSDGQDYTHIVRYSNFHERQRLLCLGIPVVGLYQKALGEQWRMVAGLGFLGSWQVLGKVKRTKGDINTVGWFEEYHCELYGMENHWFMDYDKVNAKFKSKMQISVIGDCNFNYVFKKNPKWELSMGVYGQYVMDNIHKQKSEQQFDYTSETFNGAMKTDIINKVHPFSVGAKCGIRYYLEPKAKQNLPTIEAEKPIVQQDTTTIEEVVEQEPKVEEEIVEEVKEEEPKVVETVPEPEPEPKKEPEPEPIPEPKPEPVKELPKRITINCEFNSSDPMFTGYVDLLDDIANYLKAHPDAKFRIIGHTDNVGSYQSNFNLGLKRAQEVKAELVKRGANPSQIGTYSKSYTEPIVNNDTPENRALNRRVEMTFE